MSIIPILGRRVDLLAFQGDYPGDRELQAELTLVPEGTGGYLCAGIQKLAQRFLTVLLLKRGSLVYFPTSGTLFMIQAEQGLWRTISDVTQAFYSARLATLRQMQAVELSTDPADERIGDAQLLSVTLTPDTVNLRIQLTSLAGSSYTFITPITVPIH
jgi:hypothetical protein